MDARARFYALAVSAALVAAAGAMASSEAMAQADEAAVETGEAAAQAEDATAQDEAVERPVPKQKPAVVERQAKADLDQSAVRPAPVTPLPRATRTSTRAIIVPKILGSYR